MYTVALGTKPVREGMAKYKIRNRKKERRERRKGEKEEKNQESVKIKEKIEARLIPNRCRAGHCVRSADDFLSPFLRLFFYSSFPHSVLKQL